MSSVQDQLEGTLCRRSRGSGVSIGKGMFGDTGCTAIVHCEEHRYAYIKRRKFSNLWDHVGDMHEGLSEEVEFEYEVMRRYPL